ncbi:MAG: S9 family peptidase [Pseudomonadota bacterium]|nr:S9 family peptidase [Pseudomonadota bacterium]
MRMLLLPLTLLAATPALARQLTPMDLVTMSRVGEAAVSPDGHWLVWEQQETDLAANRARHDLWRLALDRPAAHPQKIAMGDDGNDTAPAFGSDGLLYFLSSGKDDKNAVYRLAMDGGAPNRVTGDYDLSGFEVSPTGEAILVWADRPVGATSLDATSPVPPGPGSGRLYDQLFVRHWNRWADGLRSQLFVIPMRNGHAAGGGRGIAPSLVGDTPSKPGGGSEEIAWSADGRSIVFALRQAGRIEPLSENFDLFETTAAGTTRPVDLTPANKAIDTDPTISPDGHWLAWLATTRPGYENDRHVVWLRDLTTGKVRALTGRWDRSVESLRWASDSRSLYVTAADALDHPVFGVAVADGAVRRLTGAGHASGVVPLPHGGFVFELDSITAPPDFWRYAPGGEITRLTAINASQFADVAWPAMTRFTFAGAGGDRVQGFALRPAGLAPGAKAPVAFMVHGGPQSTFPDRWIYNWNLAAWAGHGYGVVSVDFHGSVGYGQAFTDSINRDWGGKPLTDLKLGLAAALARFDYLDGGRVCAAGGSYGGYMMNWIEGHWPDRFRCLVQHDGVFDVRGMTYATDELAPDHWDFGNRPYYLTPGEYEKWNPVNAVAAWKTPQLVITGERDFRSPDTQAIAAFTALQERGVPSQLLVFPDEGHVVGKPKNSLQWYDTVFAWMDRWTNTARPSR